MPGVKAVVTGHGHRADRREGLARRRRRVRPARHGRQPARARQGAVPRPRGGRRRGDHARHRARSGDARSRSTYERARAGDERSTGARRRTRRSCTTTWSTQGKPAAHATGPTNIAGRMELRRGDVDQGFAEADVIVEREFRTPMVHQGYIEPHACVARYGADGRVVVWTHARRDRSSCATRCAGILGIDAAHDQGDRRARSAAASAARFRSTSSRSRSCSSRKARRPVKMVMTRDEVFRATGPTSGTQDRDEDGREARRHASSPRARRCGTRPAPTAARRPAPARCAASRCYTIPNFFIEALRRRRQQAEGGGVSRARLADGDVRDRVADRRDRARSSSMDPIELRLKNAVDEGDQAPYGPKYGPIGLQAGARGRAQHPHWTAPLGAEPGTRRGVRLLVQRRHELERHGFARAATAARRSSPAIPTSAARAWRRR